MKPWTSQATVPTLGAKFVPCPKCGFHGHFILTNGETDSLECMSRHEAGKRLNILIGEKKISQEERGDIERDLMVTRLFLSMNSINLNLIQHDLHVSSSPNNECWQIFVDKFI